MSEQNTRPIDRLLTIMAQLRDPETGCEWDRAQDFRSIAPYTIEEAYEVADAIERDDIAALKDELGDLLLQVVFHSRMAEEAGHFGFTDVAKAICDKLQARHPHIFTDIADNHANQTDRWEMLKAQERSAKGATSALDGVAMALPALMRSEKLQKRAARTGFDWPDHAGSIAKLHEELGELNAATTDADRLLEAGDLLFAAVNVVRSFSIVPENALRAGNAKFERRFRKMEELADSDGRNFAELSLDEQEAYWLAAKALERAETS
ncbi:MAG: nucleoside triphosphate pyrophosphohydrolase [Sphingomonadaceae bacterium]|nr:nucleoside triphosphate pyrophosphohydrolase [Sphingomonadaceae bacterium]